MRSRRAGLDDDVRTVAAVLPWLDPAEDLRRRRVVAAGLLGAGLVHFLLLVLPLFEKEAGPRRRLELTPEPFRLSAAPVPRDPEPPPPPEPRAPEPPAPTLRVPVPDLPDPVPLPRVPQIAPPVAPSVVALDPPFVVPGPPPPPEDPIVEWSAGIERPERLSGTDPAYTECARRVRIQGTVVLETVIGRDGRAREVRILRDLPCGLGRAAADAISGWTFRPATRNGSPLSVRYRLTAKFTLQ